MDYKAIQKLKSICPFNDVSNSASFILSDDVDDLPNELDKVSIFIQNCDLQSNFEELRPVVNKLIRILHDFSPEDEIHKIAFKLICLFAKESSYFDDQLMFEMEYYCKSLLEAGKVEQAQIPLMFSLFTRISARNPGLVPYTVLRFLPFQKSDILTIILNLSKIKLPVRFASHTWKSIIKDEINNIQAKILYRIVKHNSLDWDQITDEIDIIKLISKARTSTAALGTLMQLSIKSYTCKGFINYASDDVRTIISIIIKNEINDEPRMLMKILTKIDFILEQGEIMKIIKSAENAEGGIRVKFNEFLQKQSSMAFTRILEIIMGINKNEFERELLHHYKILNEQEITLAIPRSIIAVCNKILRSKYLKGEKIILTTNEREGHNATNMCNMLLEKCEELLIIRPRESIESRFILNMIFDLKESMEIGVVVITKNEEWEGITISEEFDIFFEEEYDYEEDCAENIDE